MNDIHDVTKQLLLDFAALHMKTSESYQYGIIHILQMHRYSKFGRGWMARGRVCF